MMEAEHTVLTARRGLNVVFFYGDISTCCFEYLTKQNVFLKSLYLGLVLFHRIFDDEVTEEPVTY